MDGGGGYPGDRSPPKCQVPSGLAVRWTCSVFAYGSLKRGRANNRIIAGGSYLGEAVSDVRYRMWDTGPKVFPVVRPDPDGHRVVGEVWEVDAETLRALDAFTGEGGAYVRRTRGVWITVGVPRGVVDWAGLQSSPTLTADVYEASPDGPDPAGAPVLPGQDKLLRWP